MGSFSIKPGQIDSLTKKIKDIAFIAEADTEKKVKAITQIVYSTARARRPKISIQEHKALGGTKGGYRVSDPNAILGVPVDTGALQASIQQKTYNQGGKFYGEISAGDGLAYASAIEFGTSKMAPRPFMRPAWNENQDVIKKVYTAPITGKK